MVYWKIILGRICDETEIALDLPHQSASARYPELRHIEAIEYLRDSNLNRVQRATRTGRPAYVHVVTAYGRELIRLGLPIPYDRDITRKRHGDNPMSAIAKSSGRKIHATQRLEVLKDIASQS